MGPAAALGMARPPGAAEVVPAFDKHDRPRRRWSHGRTHGKHARPYAQLRRGRALATGPALARRVGAHGSFLTCQPVFGICSVLSGIQLREGSWASEQAFSGLTRRGTR